MKYFDEYRNKKLIKRLITEIKKIEIDRINLMEVCGTHTVAIFKNGIRRLLPKNINLISGPGCPVCVTAQIDINRIITLARKKNVIIATFGDIMRIPGSEGSLEKEKASGADIRIIYSPSEALKIAQKNKNKEIILLAVGFETTAPLVAWVIKDVKRKKIRNFSIYCSHKIIPPAIKAILETKEVRLDGFILPGHVSCIIGSQAYEFIPQDYKVACVISGFEPVDILESILFLLKQINQKKPRVQIQYKRAVQPLGNILAQKILKQVFIETDCFWRGLGTIPGSGYKLQQRYLDFDAKKKFKLKNVISSESKNCLCGEILRGIKKPSECKLFAKICQPENPYGPCMVSSEGSCAVWYKYNLNSDI